MAINFGLLNTNAPAELGATVGNALALRRQRDIQDQQLLQQQEQFRVQNALSNMQLQKAQQDAQEQANFRNAFGSMQQGAETATPEMYRASPQLAMAFEKQRFEQRKGQAEMEKSGADVAMKRLDMMGRVAGSFAQNPTRQTAEASIEQLRMLDVPEQTLSTLRSQLSSTPDEQLPRLANQWLSQSDAAVKAQAERLFPKPAAPSDLSRLISERDALPPGDPRRATYDAAISKSTTHAPAAVTNVSMTQEKEESKAVGKGFGEQYNAIQKAGLDAGGKIARYERMGQLLQGVSTGTLTPTGTQISALADSIGLSIDPKLPAKQAAEALSNEIALQLRNPSGGAGMPGALSDRDREFLVGMTPGLSKTPEGNRIIMETAIKLAKREQEVARIARDYRKRNGTLDEGFYNELESFSAKNPLFQPAARQASGSGPSVGAIDGGYRFRGGNPADPKSWEKVQ